MMFNQKGIQVEIQLEIQPIELASEPAVRKQTGNILGRHFSPRPVDEEDQRLYLRDRLEHHCQAVDRILAAPPLQAPEIRAMLWHQSKIRAYEQALHVEPVVVEPQAPRSEQRASDPPTVSSPAEPAAASPKLFLVPTQSLAARAADEAVQASPVAPTVRETTPTPDALDEKAEQARQKAEHHRIRDAYWAECQADGVEIPTNEMLAHMIFPKSKRPISQFNDWLRAKPPYYGNGSKHDRRARRFFLVEKPHLKKPNLPSVTR
jgi:hypothetical protein